MEMEEMMRRVISTLAGAVALALASAPGWAQDKVIKFGFAEDFTKVYTFVTSEYNQGQRDYLALINVKSAAPVGHQVSAPAASEEAVAQPAHEAVVGAAGGIH